jgi:subtilisin family serine protease
MVGQVLRRPHVPLVALACMLLAAPGATAATDRPAPPLVPATPAPTFAPGRAIVQWASDADRGDRADARADADVSFRATLGDADFQLVQVQPGQTVGGAVAELEADPAVAVAERDGYSVPTGLPNDPLLGQLWGLRNTGVGVAGFSGAVTGDDIDAEGAWARNVGDPPTVIADIDSGYRFEHPDLANVVWDNPGETSNGLDDDSDGIVDDLHGADFVGSDGEHPAIDGDPTDDDLRSGGHGVHTAGTIGAEGDNGIGITGVAQKAQLMPLRVCSRFAVSEDSRCPNSAIVAAINYAGAKGARVANISLVSTAFSQAEVNALAANPNVLFVISAGNDGVDNDSTPHYPCDFEPRAEAVPPVPEAIDNVVCVAATDQADELAGFSDWGAGSVDLGAPGTEILSTYPFVEPFAENFEGDDFSSRWLVTGVDGGFEPTEEAPLTSFGMTDAVGAPAASTERETTSAPIALPPNGGCELLQTRHLDLAGSESFRYSVLLDGIEEIAREPTSSAEPGLERRFLELPAAFEAGGSVQLRFRFTTGATPASASGVWLDDLSIDCAQAVGQASGYGFLEGTSMAAPHVTGAAALMFSVKPTATVTEVRTALLASVDANTSLEGQTVSGGRLDAGAAISYLEPPVPILTSTDPASPAPSWYPRIIGSAEAGSTVRIFNGTSCAGSPVTVGSGEELGTFGLQVTVFAETTAQFSATATNDAGNTSQCSAAISFTNTAKIGPSSVLVTPPPFQTSSAPASGSPATPSACLVPKLVGKTLAQAKAALANAGCRVGTVAKPRPRRGRRPAPLVVKGISPAAGSLSSGAVDLTLGPKPKRHRH